MATNDETPILNYKTPTESYQNAIGFTDTDNSKTVELSSIVGYLKKLNDSNFVYPLVACIVVLIFLLIITFQKSIKTGLKVTSSFVFFIFVIFSAWTFKRNTSSTTD